MAILDWGKGGLSETNGAVEVPLLHLAARARGKEPLSCEHVQPIHLLLFSSAGLKRGRHSAGGGLEHFDRALCIAGEHMVTIKMPAHAHHLGAGKPDRFCCRCVGNVAPNEPASLSHRGKA